MKAQFETGAHVKVISYPDKAIVDKECVIIGTVSSMMGSLPFYKVRLANGKKEYTVGESRLVPWKEEQPEKLRVIIGVAMDSDNDVERIKEELELGKMYGSIPGIVELKFRLSDEEDELLLRIEAEVDGATTDLELGLLIRAMYNAMGHLGPIELHARVNGIYLMSYHYFSFKGFAPTRDFKQKIQYKYFTQLPGKGGEIGVFDLDCRLALQAPECFYRKLVSESISGVKLQYHDLLKKYYEWIC